MDSINLDIAKKYDIKTRRNDSFNLNIYFFENDGVTPWTGVSSYTHTLQVKDNNNSIILNFTGDTITIDETNGVANIFMPYENMNVPNGGYKYDYQLRQDISHERKTFLYGNFTITKDISD